MRDIVEAFVTRVGHFKCLIFISSVKRRKNIQQMEIRIGCHLMRYEKEEEGRGRWNREENESGAGGALCSFIYPVLYMGIRPNEVNGETVGSNPETYNPATSHGGVGYGH